MNYQRRCLVLIAAAKPFLFEAYQQRYVALEVFYLGWSYHGFASQCGTEGTVEVQPPYLFSLHAMSGHHAFTCCTYEL